ncbi:hypothetical protein BD413DRAFT_313814 [Trametes elegans]|nr:hypothetical protein BD413DRAFT_313814 [Trametes elegans]
MCCSALRLYDDRPRAGAGTTWRGGRPGRCGGPRFNIRKAGCAGDVNGCSRSSPACDRSGGEGRVLSPDGASTSRGRSPGVLGAGVRRARSRCAYKKRLVWPGRSPFVTHRQGELSASTQRTPRRDRGRRDKHCTPSLSVRRQPQPATWPR